MLPSFDRDRGVYGFKESLLADKLIVAHGIGKSSDLAARLKNWRTPSVRQTLQRISLQSLSTSNFVGDYAANAADLLRNHVATKCQLTITEVNRRLDRLAEANGAKVADGKSSELPKFNLQRVCRVDHERADLPYAQL